MVILRIPRSNGKTCVAATIDVPGPMVLNIIKPNNANVTWEFMGIYHGRFAESLIIHCHSLFTVPGYRVAGARGHRQLEGIGFVTFGE